jgi:hypothetical protein
MAGGKKMPLGIQTKIQFVVAKICQIFEVLVLTCCTICEI